MAFDYYKNTCQISSCSNMGFCNSHAASKRKLLLSHEKTLIPRLVTVPVLTSQDPIIRHKGKSTKYTKLNQFLSLTVTRILNMAYALLQKGTNYSNTNRWLYLPFSADIYMVQPVIFSQSNLKPNATSYPVSGPSQIAPNQHWPPNVTYIQSTLGDSNNTNIYNPLADLSKLILEKLYTLHNP